MSNTRNHLLLFAGIQFLISITFQIVGYKTNTGDTAMAIINILGFLQIPFMFYLMIKTFKGGHLSKIKKSFFLIYLITVNLFCSITINLINPFGRNIKMEDIQFGIYGLLISSLISFIISVPFIWTVKSRAH